MILPIILRSSKYLTWLFCLFALLWPEALRAGAEDWAKLMGNGKRAKSDAFAYMEDNPALPRVLLIGDSISVGYTAPTRKFLEGKANVHRIWQNGGSTLNALPALSRWLGKGKWAAVQGSHWDVIHFNWGLHDLKYVKDGKIDFAGTQETSLVEYEKNLRKLVAELKATGAVLIWASTTPVPKGSVGRVAGDEVLYNEVAAKVMKENGIAINDLWGVVKPRLDEYQRPNNVHFLALGSEVLGTAVAQAIEKEWNDSRRKLSIEENKE